MGVDLEDTPLFSGGAKSGNQEDKPPNQATFFKR